MTCPFKEISTFPALSFYQSVKRAAKRNVTGADTMYQDLKARFQKGPSTPPTPPTT